MTYAQIASQKLHGSQHCPVRMLENWKNALDKDDSSCTICMDLFDKFLIQ